MKKKPLPNRQLEIMNALWESSKPLLISEIAEQCSISTPTVQYSIKALCKIGYVEVADIVHSSKVLARTFRPVIKKEEYLNILAEKIGTNANSIPLVSLVEKENDWDVLDEVERIIQKKRQEKAK